MSFKKKLDTYALQSGVSVKRDFQTSHNTSAIRTSHYSNVKSYEDLIKLVDIGDHPTNVTIGTKTVNIKSRQATMLSGNRAVVVDIYQNKRKGNKQPAQVNAPSSMTVFSFGMRSLPVPAYGIEKNEQVLVVDRLEDKALQDYGNRANGGSDPYDLDLQYFLLEFPFVLPYSPLSSNAGVAGMAGNYNSNTQNIAKVDWPKAHVRFGISDVTTHEITGSQGTALQYTGVYRYWLCPPGQPTNGFRRMVPMVKAVGDENKNAMVLVPMGKLVEFNTPNFS